jgi:hypothetical protein
MKPTQVLQEIWKMRFEEAHEGIPCEQFERTV